MPFKTKKRKIAASIGAVAMAAAILLTGTFAWQSISQQALNETMSAVNPGGRLHDDFDGRNKDVYVENFGDTPIFARVRLDEYMELGQDAGKNLEAEDRNATPLAAGSSINDKTTWKPHIPNAEDDPFHEHWTWTMGGKTVYMPTFNKNKDSLKADINGTYEGTTPDDNVHFDDYVTYTDGQEKTADAVYDIDTNDVDEGDSAVEGTNIETIEETHTARETQTAQVMTMAEWKEKGSPLGKYWVYDTDGWAYWAELLQPGEATGLLLDGIRMTSIQDDNWYYAINVTGQFVTPDDVGNADDDTGLFGPDAGGAPSADAMDLINQAVETELIEEGGKTYMSYGDNTYKEVQADGTAGDLFCGGADGKPGGGDDRTDVVVLEPADETYGDKFLGPDGSDSSYLAKGPDGKLGTSDDIKVWGNPTLEDEIVAKNPVDTVTISAAGSATKVTAGATLQFTASVTGNGTPAANQAVTWSVSGNSSASTTISSGGLLTVGADETASSLTVKAVSQQNTAVSGTKSVAVSPLFVGQIGNITPGSADTVTIDSIEFYVLAKEDTKAMLITKDIQEKKVFDADSPRWQDSDLRTYLNGTWLNSKPTLQKYAVSTTIKTRSTYDGSDFDTTNDKVFLLSEADVNGTHNNSVAQADDYTYNGQKLPAPDGSWTVDFSSASWYWLRSPFSFTNSVACINSLGRPTNYNQNNPGGVRPALWIDLSK